MKVFNTLSGKKEEFVPQGDEVTMYVCGVTPYSDAHLGHAMSYIIFDVIHRYLKFRGYRVRYVQNVTDIDDKIIDRANQRGVSARELAGEFIASYTEEMKLLNIEPPDENPYATDVIPDMIEVIQGLIDKGYAYPAQGSVYFRVRNVPDYGKLSHRSLESMRTGGTCELGEEKEDPLDFVLWKAAKPGEPSWESPWGEGRPGWHIECSTMSLKYLGKTIDIHGGGQDLIFPHHENEIAQSESFTGQKPFVKYWLHNGMVQLGEEKMSKSLGNLITIKEALERYSADALRIFVLSSHYRSPLTYSEDALEAAERGAERLLRVVSRDNPTGGKGDALDAEQYRKQFIEAMDDDFNTPKALAILFDLARAINQAADSGIGFSDAKKIILSFSYHVLGLKLEAFDSLLREQEKEIKPLVDFLVEVRLHLRINKRFEFADRIRNSLSELHIILEDRRGLKDPQEANTVQMWKRDFKRETTPDDIEFLSNLLIEVIPTLRELNQHELAGEIRNKLAELGIAFEDTT